MYMGSNWKLQGKYLVKPASRVKVHGLFGTVVSSNVIFPTERLKKIDTFILINYGD